MNTEEMEDTINNTYFCAIYALATIDNIKHAGLLHDIGKLRIPYYETTC